MDKNLKPNETKHTCGWCGTWFDDDPVFSDGLEMCSSECQRKNDAHERRATADDEKAGRL
jgi:hypothetical protein